MKRSFMAIGTVMILALSSTALAKSKYMKQLVAEYPEAKATCATCHLKPLPTKADRELNPFGLDFKAKSVVDPNAPKKIRDFKKIEALDSDGDGKTNGEELKAGTNPGDPKLK